MTLSQRTIFVIVCTFIALLFVLAITSDVILLSSYSTLEKAEITSHTRHISNLINDRLKQLNLSAQEVAEQIKDNDALLFSSERADNQLFTVHFMRSHSIDLAAIYDSTGSLVTISGFNNEKNESASVPIEQQQALGGLVARVSALEGTAVKGVVNLAGSPFIVVFKLVKGRNGEKRGIVAVGWIIDRVEIERVLRSVGTSIAVYDLKSSLLPDVRKAVGALEDDGSIYAAVIENKSVAGYFVLKDIFGQRSFIIRALEQRMLFEHGKVTIAYIFMALFLAGGILCCVMLIFIRKTILVRLQTLTAKVRLITDIPDISARVPVSDHQDELNTLALSINNMLESLQNAEVGMRESEERYRMLFERAPDAIVIIGLEGDQSGRIVAANQAAADQHGYSLDELCGMLIYDVNTAETNKIAGDLIATIATGEWVTAEIWHHKKDGTRFPIEIHAGLIKIGGIKYILGFDRDITQRKITEETYQTHLEQISELNDELSRQAIDLAAANNELETFNYSVSHDMRGPLTRISGYCQLLLDDDRGLDTEVREYIARIYESEIWLNEMIDALLHLARISRAEIVSGTVNLSAIAEATLKELSLEYPALSVKTHIEPDIVVAGDSRLLKMVMINLLNNAWKYSSGKSDVLIEFGVDQTDFGPVYYVRDNGAGFDMKDAGKLFRVFTRLHDSSQFAGTGIGLATVQRIILRHGGRIWAKGEAGISATFFFTLP